MNKKSTQIIIAVVILIVGFGAGLAYGKNSAAAPAATRSGFTGSTGARGAFAGRGGAGGVIGTVAAKDANTISIQLIATSSGSQIVLYSPSTAITKTISGTIDDVSIGSSVIVQGTPNPDGSVSANSIQIRPTQQSQTTGQ